MTVVTYSQTHPFSNNCPSLVLQPSGLILFPLRALSPSHVSFSGLERRVLVVLVAEVISESDWMKINHRSSSYVR